MTNQSKTVCSNEDCLSNQLEAVTEAAKAAMQEPICTFCGSQRFYADQTAQRFVLCEPDAGLMEALSRLR
jgi:hypothetical protein